MKALPTCDLSLKILCKLFNVLEVCFGLCVQKREGVFREEASRVGLGKRCGKLCFIQRAILEKMGFFPTLVGYPLQVKSHTACTGGSSTKPCTTLTWMMV